METHIYWRKSCDSHLVTNEQRMSVLFNPVVDIVIIYIIKYSHFWVANGKNKKAQKQNGMDFGTEVTAFTCHTGW